MTTTARELRGRFEALRANKFFESFVIAVIIVSALLIGAKVILPFISGLRSRA